MHTIFNAYGSFSRSNFPYQRTEQRNAGGGSILLLIHRMKSANAMRKYPGTTYSGGARSVVVPMRAIEEHRAPAEVPWNVTNVFPDHTTDCLLVRVRHS